MVLWLDFLLLLFFLLHFLRFFFFISIFLACHKFKTKAINGFQYMIQFIASHTALMCSCSFDSHSVEVHKSSHSPHPHPHPHPAHVCAKWKRFLALGISIVDCEWNVNFWHNFSSQQLYHINLNVMYEKKKSFFSLAFFFPSDFPSILRMDLTMVSIHREEKIKHEKFFFFRKVFPTGKRYIEHFHLFQSIFTTK